MGMELDLPEPSTQKLPRSPLKLVVCQVRHDHNVAATDPKRALKIHEALREEYPLLDQQSNQELAIAAGFGGLQALPLQPTAQGWRLHTPDGTWTVVLMPDFFALETTAYDDWPDFRGRLERLIRAVVVSTDPSVEQRLGLRMIDRITHPTVKEARDWVGLIDGSIAGPIAHPQLGPGVSGSQQIFQIDAGDGRAAIVRHGAFRDAAASNEQVYMLDYDCYIQRARSFDGDDALTQIESLHTFALQLFQAAIMPKLYRYLRRRT
jgi:uncharacterized protein (TIGR04255 family)